MSLPLLAHSKLFFYYQNKIDCCWYLGLGNDTSVAKQDAYIRDMNRFGIDTITLNVCNEGMSSPFSGEFMNSPLHEGKMNGLVNFGQRLKNAGKKIVIVYFDFPMIPDSEHPKYPVWKFKDRVPAFLEFGTRFLAPHVDGFLLGIESNRQPGLSIEEVEYGIKFIQQFAVKSIGGKEVKLPVGTHEQNVAWRFNESTGKDEPYLTRRVPIGAKVVGYETSNHPFNGDSVSVQRMVEEVSFLVRNSNGASVWVIESNSNESQRAKDQNNAMANISGVVGVGGPL